MKLVQEVLTRFSDVKLTVNLSKSEFSHAEAGFLGNAVGNGQVKPLNVKILKYPAPKTKKELIKFLEMVGYYRQICQNFSVIIITAPLTNLLRKDQDYIWSKMFS